MDNNKIQAIIAEQNEQNERQTVREATEIIREIARLQETITKTADCCNSKIEDLRKELQTLTAPVLNPTSILGA